MDLKALFNLSYGVFVLATKVGDRKNGCITNTCIQVANEPTRIAIAVINQNLTCEMIKESKVFTVSLLDTSTSYDTIKYYGMQSGREVEKYLGDTLNVNGIELPYLSWSCNSVLAAHVVEEYDLGSHTLFIAELDEAIKLNDNPPLTYEYYQSNIKPKPEMPKSDKKIIGWRCKICGFEYEGETLPEDYLCPLCGHDASDFEPIYEN